MNIRFEKNQIRIRITELEASELVRNSLVIEKFQYLPFNEPLVVELRTTEKIFSFSLGKNKYILDVPVSKLSGKSGESFRESTCEATVTIHQELIQIIFEIDIFKRKKNPN